MLPPALTAARPHVPVLLDAVLRQLAPADGEVFVDGTFGAGGYSSAILGAADTRVIAIDRDATAIAAGSAVRAAAAGRLTLVEGRFSALADHVRGLGLQAVDGVVLDIGVSSMQLDQAARGFSFLREGPLDMRMGSDGPSAADHVNRLAQAELANVIYAYGEEPRARAIARAIVAARTETPIVTTPGLVRAVERATGPQRARDRIHPATRTFQALRIFVNDELAELAAALSGAEQILRAGGRLVVVSFHSLEDRIVKRFMTERSGHRPAASRHLPAQSQGPEPSFTLPFKGHVAAEEAEAEANPRARSAKLRCAVRTAAPAWPAFRDVPQALEVS